MRKLRAIQRIYKCMQITEMGKRHKYKPSTKLVAVNRKIRFKMYLILLIDFYFLEQF